MKDVKERILLMKTVSVVPIFYMLAKEIGGINSYFAKPSDCYIKKYITVSLSHSCSTVAVLSIAINAKK